MTPSCRALERLRLLPEVPAGTLPAVLLRCAVKLNANCILCFDDGPLMVDGGPLMGDKRFASC